MLRIISFLIGITTISSSIILFSSNSPSISSIYAQDTPYYNNNNNNTNENNNSSFLINELEKVKNILESKVTKLATALQIASSLPQILEHHDVNLIDPKVNGIQEDADIEKRKIAKILLDQFNEFSSIGLLLNNGYVYFVEPFERQLNLTTNNLSFRDYYQAVVHTKKTYLSDAIISKSSGRNLAVMATPIINNKNNMTGILYGSINFNNYDKFLQSLNLQNNTKLVLIDKTGVKMGDSNVNETSVSKESFEKKQFSNLTSVQYALEDKSGSILEKFEGKESQITFLPYDLFQNKRILLLIQDCNSDKKPNESNKCINNNGNNNELNLFNENTLSNLGSFF
ncbi:MAG TPA: cache domain-containing protein [Nitrososphaeraceae archaeon]|nr:cache domain-containing protein [Nitrososphaeraceae archaeon]